MRDATNKEHPLSRAAWFIPLAYGALLVVSSCYWLVAGAPFDVVTWQRVAGTSWSLAAHPNPATARVVATLFREFGGGLGLTAGVLILFIAATGFRRGERWAWFAMCVLPIHATVDLAVVAAAGGMNAGSAIADGLLIGLMGFSLALAFPRRRRL